MSTLARVIEVISEVFEIPAKEIGPNDRFAEDLGVTSLDVVNLVWRVEEVFGLGELPEDALESVKTVGELVALIEPLRGEPSEAVEIDDVAIAADHAGVDFKADLCAWLHSQQKSVRDLGPSDSASVDYPDFAERVGRVVARGEAKLGILICGSGVGMSIAANKIDGIRAVLVTNPVQAALSRQHNNANVLCLGARLTGPDMAKACIEAFLTTPFDPGDDGRHRRRVARITELEGRGDTDS